MLKIYDKLEDVPEALRGEYKLVGGKYVPDLSDDHPVLVNNRTLLSEKQTAESKVSGLQAEVESAKADVQSAKANGLPRGHVAVPKAEAEILDQVKEHGTPTEIVAKLSEHKTLKAETEQRKREDNLRLVAKELGYDNADAFVRLPNLPEFEIREKDGKKTVIVKVKDAAGTITEKDAKEFIEASPDVAPFLSALKTQPTGTRVPEQRRDNGKPAGNFYDGIREDGKKRTEAAKETSIPLNQRAGLQVIGSKAA